MTNNPILSDNNFISNFDIYQVNSKPPLELIDWSNLTLKVYKFR